MTTTKAIIEGTVQRLPSGKIEVLGSIEMDDSYLGRSWPDNPVRIETSVSVESHLRDYLGQRVRVTIERLEQ